MPRPSRRPEQGAQDVPVSLVEAKLAPPQVRADVLPRDPLVQRLLDVGDGAIAALVAPAGYGKTTVLALWRAREPRPVAWLTVDDADADPSRFLAHLAAAIGHVGGRDLSDLERLLASPVSALSAAIPHLLAALSRSASPLVLILDDVHLLGGTETADALTMLIDYLPPQVTMVIAGRGDGGLPLARYRASGRLVDLGARDLSFDEGESISLAAILGRALDGTRARALQDATEGWPAAVYLALRRAPDDAPGRAMAALPAGDPDLGAYIDAELLRGIPPRTRAFMTRTSVLDRLTPALCDAVAGHPGSGRILRDLAAGSQLVASLDMPGEWYRYHPLLRRHLLARLEGDGGAADAHRRAASWYARSDRGDAAVEHLFAAGDRDGAAAVATRLVLPLYRSGREATTLRWLDRLSEDDLRRHPIIATFGALAAALDGRHLTADRLAAIAEASEYQGPVPSGAEPFHAARLTVRSLMAPHGLDAAIADAEAASAEDPPGSQWRPLTRAVLGVVLAVAGDGDRADSVLEGVAAEARAHGAGRAESVASAWRAMLAIERDDWARVGDLARDGLAAVAHHAHDPDATVSGVLVVGARAAVNRGDVSEARRLMATFHMSREALGPATPWLSVRSLLEAAHANLALADPAGARSCLTQAADIIARRPALGRLAARVEDLRSRIRNLPPGPGGASTLTPAEIRVLRLLPTYLTAAEMADRLCVSTNTVRTQIQAVYGKLGAASRGEAVEAAIEAGLLEPLPVLSDRRLAGT